MNINRLKRALRRGNRVVLFAVVSGREADSVKGRIDYGSAVVCASFADLAAAERFRRQSNEVRRTPTGAKAVVVPYLEVVKATKEHPHPLNALLSSMSCRSIDGIASETKLDASYLHAVRAVYLD